MGIEPTSEPWGLLNLTRVSALPVQQHNRSRFQPTTQPTEYDVLYDLRGVWQSPRSCMLL